MVDAAFAVLFALAFVPPLVPTPLVPAPLAPPLAGDFPPLALGPTRGPLSAMVWRSEARIPLGRSAVALAPEESSELPWWIGLPCSSRYIVLVMNAC